MNSEWSDKDKAEIFVTSYPRSGNTWLNRLLCRILRSPLKNSEDMNPSWCGPERDGDYVVRKVHRAASQKIPRGSWVLIQRDPRDIAVSVMFYKNIPTLDATIRKLLDGTDEDEQYGHYESWLRSWLDNPGLLDAITRYETLHASPVMELQRVICCLTGDSPDGSWIRACYDLEQFAKVRAEGHYDHAMRRGIAGDWRNHFTRSDGHLLEEGMGGLMRETGYTSDDSWWQELPERLI